MADSIDDILAGFDALDGLNYVVSLALYRTPANPDWSPREYVVAALGSGTVVTGIEAASGARLLAEVEHCLGYRGDSGHGPDRAFLFSPRYQELLAGLRAHLERAIAEASVWSFALSRASHPFYPVFWEFAFLIVRPDGGEVFIGASSD